MERRGTPVTSLIADGVAESAAAQSAAAAASSSADPVELDDTGVRAGSAGGGGSGGGAAPAPAEGEAEGEVGEEGEVAEAAEVAEVAEVAEAAEVAEVGEVGEGPRDPRRPWAGTKPALKPLNGISDEQASMFMCRLGGATACYPRPIGMRGSGSRVLCRGVSQPLSAHWQHLVLMLCANVAHCCTYQRAVRRGGSVRRCARTSAAPDRTETDPARIVYLNDAPAQGAAARYRRVRHLSTHTAYR